MSADEAMRTGRITYVTDRLFGFITEDETNAQFFVHAEDVVGGRKGWAFINQGDRVLFHAAPANGRSHPRAQVVVVTQRVRARRRRRLGYMEQVAVKVVTQGAES